MTMSHVRLSSAAFMSGAVSTRCQATSNPPPSSSMSKSWASRSESSTMRTLSGLPMRGAPGVGGCFVEQEPIEPELPHGLHELREIDGLSHEAVGARSVSLQAIAVFFGGGENDNRQEARMPGLPDAPQDLYAVELGVLQVE